MELLPHLFGGVAPFTGAWIEMPYLGSGCAIAASLPSRERGLKSRVIADSLDAVGSLPSRERGLKFLHHELKTDRVVSLPSRERGLKSR